MAARRIQNGSKTNKKTRISRSLVEKCEKAFGTTIVMYFWFSGVWKTSIFLNLESKWDQVGNQNRSKIDPKTRSACEGILEPIFLPFWWGSGAKLGGKIEPGSKKNCIENMMQNQSRSEGVLDRFGVDFGLQNGTQMRPNIPRVFTFEAPGPYFEPTSARDGPRTTFWMLLVQFLDAFGKNLVRFWIHFWPSNAKRCKKMQKKKL